jgi:drug/metabolite transporter (DMT)-like permease
MSAKMKRRLHMSLTLFPALLMLLSGSIHALVNAMIKGGGNRMVQMILVSGTGTVIAAPFAFFVPLPHGAWPWIGAATCVHLVYFYCLVRALDGGDLSSAYPIFRGVAPLLTTAFTVSFLGEDVAAIGLVGIALIGGGMLAMIAGRHVNRATLGWSLATGILIALYTVIDAVGVRRAATPSSFIVWLFLVMGSLSIAAAPFVTQGQFLDLAKKQWKSGMAAGALSILTFGTALYAFSLGPTAPLAALRETGMVTALLLSIFVLKEPVTLSRICAILAICAGAVLIIAG